MSLLKLLKKKSKKTLFTTPSHNGNFCIFNKIYQWYRMDISETETFDPQNALIKSEKKAAQLYGCKYTKYLTNGSTSGIITAILASEAKSILIWDKAHPCHKNGAKLSGCKIIEYSLPFDENLGLYRAIKADYIEELLSKYKTEAIVITSPTYEGFAADIESIIKICNKYSTKLIVDEAHGALYPFSDKLPISAVKFAHYTVQSLHKTAGGINPTALLHSNDNNPTQYLDMINTTSPSYVMLAGIEANIKFLNSTRGRKCIDNLITEIKKLNLPVYNDDITKILLTKTDMSGLELSEKLFSEFNIEDEKTNDNSVLLLCGIGTDKRMLTKLKTALKKLTY